jgi:hypothetical protein
MEEPKKTEKATNPVDDAIAALGRAARLSEDELAAVQNALAALIKRTK